MASIFDPRCAQPAYLMDSEDVATACGRLSGRISGLLVGLVLAVFVFSTMRHQKTTIFVSVAVAAIVCAVVIFILSVIGGAFMRQKFHSGQLNIKKLEDMGMTRQQALAQEAQMYNTQQLAGAAGNGNWGAFAGGAVLGSMLTN